MAETPDLEATIEALRASGAAERDPARFAYLDALARRAAAQPEAIRQLLNAKAGVAASEIAAKLAQPLTETSREDTVSPLTELLAYIGQQTEEPSEAMQSATESPTEPASAYGSSLPDSNGSSMTLVRPGPELKSVARFHETWSRLSTEQQLTQTLAQAPQNAGPMNSQHLVLRSLQFMRDIAPDYLQGFMSYVDALIWLEDAAPTKPAASRSPGGERENKARTAKRSRTNR